MSSVALFRGAGRVRYRQRIDPRYERERVSNGSFHRPRRNGGGEERAARLFKGIIYFLLAVLLLEICFHLFIAPQLVIRTVNIKAREEFPMTDEEIMEVAGIRESPYYFSVSTERVERQLEQIPIVREASVTKGFPDTMTIEMRERKPLGLLMITGEEGMRQALVDREGVVFRVGGDEVPDLPILSGIEIPKAAAGMQLPEQVKGFFQDLHRLRQEVPSLYRLISEVKFVKKNGSSFEVLLYPAHFQVRVRLGPTLDTHTLKYIMLVLDVISKRGMENEVVEVDFRTEHVVYRVGEE